ncbi:cry4 [Bugula neritina]|uniref:Cry4 n=1 Tax=Bugula neritina TaxID=10212 RepID=A0A7J7K716_BUGNE|nr:cry4 [Bugula neritina]
MCMPVPWKSVDELSMERVTSATTGFPWIDAILKQLVSEGWIHGICKHALISFITHGQLFYSWEEAANLLERYSLEGDICTNNGIAMLLSGSCYSRALPSVVHSPVLSGKHGSLGVELIRRYIPSLKSFPEEFIFEPWLAPYDIQLATGCVVAKDYPAPMIIHHQASLSANISMLHQLIRSAQERKVTKRRQKQALRPSPYLMPAPSTDT